MARFLEAKTVDGDLCLINVDQISLAFQNREATRVTVFIRGFEGYWSEIRLPGTLDAFNRALGQAPEF